MAVGGNMIAALLFTGLAVVFALLRLATRTFIVRYLGIDDLLLGLALLSTIALSGLIIFQSYNGFGEHMDTLSMMQINNFLKALWASTVIYSLAMMLIQNAFLFQYRSFFIGKWLRRMTVVMVVMVTLFGIASTVTLALQCYPTRGIWDPTYTGAKCINYRAFWLFSGTFNTITAFVIWIMPMPLIRSLKLPKRQKYWLAIVFLLGVVTVLASGLRIEALIVGVDHSKADTSYYYPGVAAWSLIEINIGIICACLPTLKPIVDRLFPQLLHDTRRNPAARGNQKPPDHHGRPSPVAASSPLQDVEAKHATFRTSLDALSTPSPKRQGDNGKTACAGEQVFD